MVFAFRGRLIALVLCIFAGPLLIAQQSTEIERANRIAKLLGVSDELARLEKLNTASPDIQQQYARILLLQQIEGSILSASLDSQAVKGNIDYEIARLQEVSSFLSVKRDRQLSLSNTATLVAGTGVGAIGSGLSIGDSTARAGAIVSASSGAAATVLAILAMRQQKGQTHTIGYTPSMLAEIFGRETARGSRYPAVIWAYFNEPDPTAPLQESWRAHLFREWQLLGRLTSSDLGPNSSKISELTSTGMSGVPLDIDTIGDRIAMLSDVRGHLAAFELDLSTLIRVVTASAPKY